MSSVSFRSSSVLLIAAFVLASGGCSSGSHLAPAAQSDPDVVALIGMEPLTLAEFERQYVRTVGSAEDAAGDSLDAYRDFLERWVDFRLKVRAAREAGLDRDSALVAELNGYREQFARPFLLDKTVIDPLIREVYEKQQQMVDVSHILLRVDPSASPDDTLRAYDKLSAVRDSILAGADFGDMALRYSEDPSASNAGGGSGYRGRLGFVRGGRLVPEFEDVAFSIPIGEVSPVFRTQFGYHILVVHDRVPAASDVRIAHIMVTPESPEDSTAAWEEVRSIRDSLASGADFAELARTHSDDGSSAGNGGDIGFVAIDGRIIPEFKDAAFALENVGDVSDPVVTRFGIHLIRLLERRQPQSLEDAYDGIRSRITRSGQLDSREEEYGRQLLEAVGYTIDTTAVRATFGSMTADSAASVMARGALIETGGSLTVATVGSRSYSASDLVKWSMSAAAATTTNDVEDYVLGMLDRFLIQKAIEYKVSRLEEENAEFRQTMADFMDGLLLFRIMEDSVWGPATTDSTELVRRYNLDPNRYRHPDRQRLIGLYSRERLVADSARGLLEQGIVPSEIVSRFADSTGSAVRLDTTMVAGPTNSVFDHATSLEVGEWTAPLSYNRGYIVIINDGTEPARTKTFDEARTEIVNEYQADLETKLVTDLRSRYGARTFPERLARAFAEGRAVEATEPDSGSGS